MRVLGFIPRIRRAYPCLSVDAGAKQGVGARTKCGHDAVGMLICHGRSSARPSTPFCRRREKKGVGARTKCGHDAAVVAVLGRALLSRALREAPSLGPIMMP
jgi:hypothetical protein